MRLYDIVKSLRETQGNLAKQAILDANKDDELFKAYMKAVYDVGLSYYQTKLPEIAGFTGDKEFGMQDITYMLTDIATRKVSGYVAIASLGGWASALNDEGRELLGYIVKRSIGASVGDTMVLTTWPDLYFIPPYMRCSGMSIKARESFAAEESFYVQVKRDGSFAYLNPGRICTRQGSCYPDWFVGLMTVGVGANEVLVGEMEVYKMSTTKEHTLLPRKEGNGILNSVLKGADESEFDDYVFKYVAWDCLSVGEFEMGYSGRPYQERWNHLFNSDYNRNIELVQNWEVRSVAEAKVIHTRLTAAGLEGSVWKRKQGVWKDTSSGTLDAVKVKLVFEVELEIIDYYEGKGKAKSMLGGLTLATKPNAEGVRELIVDCGSGFNDEGRKGFWATRSTLKGQIVTVEANEVSSARGRDTMSLSLPIFIEVRFDKREADTLERVLAQYESAKLGK